jgi:sugar (pentulose or hexulose) kinase
VTRQYLAFDLGAQSGRAMLGRFHGGAIELEEIYRFPNEPVRQNGAVQWDILRIWLEMKRALARIADRPIESLGVDGWGVDYALLGGRGNLLENPYHYRDSRNDGMMEAIFERVSRERLYSITGIQFLQINTLVQLFAACRLTPEIVDAARSLATIPDLLNYWLTGRLCSEYTVATTTQFVHAATRTWATKMVDEIGLPSRLLTTIIAPGTVVGPLRNDVSVALAGTPVIAPACHDTASAVASVYAGGNTAFISSGTWSLLGTELPAPIMSTAARDSNFTNEGGVAGTIRFLKNITGLWVLHACRESWAANGEDLSHDALIGAADDRALAFRSLIDPDHHMFLNPERMPERIREYCRQTGQPEPCTPAAHVRAILESLAFKYRVVLESLERLTATRIDVIRIVGGGSRNRLLNQFTADATGRSVVAGPMEATALGNIAMQLVATGAVGSIAEARAVIERSFPVERFEPAEADRWDAEYRRFQDYMEFTCA